jgi:hypothetical protein
MPNNERAELNTHRDCVTTDDELKSESPNPNCAVGSGHGFCAHAGAAQSTASVAPVTGDVRRHEHVDCGVAKLSHAQPTTAVGQANEMGVKHACETSSGPNGTDTTQCIAGFTQLHAALLFETHCVREPEHAAYVEPLALSV